MANIGYPTQAGSKNRLGITTATVVKAGPGVLYGIAEIVDGSAAGAVYDGTSTTGNTTANQIASVPATGNTIDNISVPFVFTKGLVVVPGTGQTLAVSYS